MKKIRHIFEYLAATLGLFILDRLSAASAEKFAIKMADLWFSLGKSRRRLTLANITTSGISSDTDEIERIGRSSFRHFAVLIIESLKSGHKFTEENWRDKIEMDIPDEVMKLFKDPKQGILLVSGHLGNWEIAAQLLSFIKPVVGITRKMNNPYTDRLMNKRKPRNNFRLTPKNDTNSGRFLSVLKNGEMLALLVDQYDRRQSAMINFFGKPASTHTSPAMLHLITKTPICFIYCIRTGPMKYKMKCSLIHTAKPSGSRKEDVNKIMNQILEKLEDAIREHPEQYLWAHRRWRMKDGKTSSV